MRGVLRRVPAALVGDEAVSARKTPGSPKPGRSAASSPERGFKTAHTPGPWSTGSNASSTPHHAICAGPHVLAVVHQLGYPMFKGRSPRSDANAQLMAAAPDLLDALVGLLPQGWLDGAMDHLPGVAAARAAIGKATSAPKPAAA